MAGGPEDRLGFVDVGKQTVARDRGGATSVLACDHVMDGTKPLLLVALQAAYLAGVGRMMSCGSSARLIMRYSG